MKPSFVIRGGTVFDGAAPRGSFADVRVDEGVITAIGSSVPADGAATIDARDGWVTPGFIDAHSHCDLASLSGHEMQVRARAGITTEIVGQDGLGFAPAVGPARDLMAEVLAPITGESPPAEWARVSDYLQSVDAGSFARVATLVPHGAVRAAVMGHASRAATPRERVAMARMVTDAMIEGAVGVSTGLSYPPALWSDIDELVDITAAMPTGKGRYVTHLRDYGHGFDAAVDEALEVGRRNGRPVHLSHFHVSGPGRAGSASRYLATMRAAAASGLNLTWDSYPYTVACTFLTTVLPADLQGRDGRTLARDLRDPVERDATAERIDRCGPGPTVAVGWDNVFLAGLDGTSLAKWNGRAVAAVADDAGTTSGRVVVDTICRLEGQACILVAQGHTDNVLAIANGNEHVVGSDGIPGSGVPHPRAGGSFLRFLRWARDGLLDAPVGQMVARMSGRTARLFGLPVGRLSVGARADLLIVDPQALSDGPDVGPYVPDAVRHSFLDGEPVIDDGRWLAPRLPGLALRGAIP
ncbi:N-acyl-D-amino-acid deacylase family protein [Amycolatopsis palatopharyngis]|uniref:N-acyl-D-amino-acid deacylase family protein n=1 Tax=Amycolatopsis palatopharyngis TaxID=187982 RepID=UPI000E249317|nr:amidohydrolase family protein [Amycolatopsis palatopharyngis]